MTLAAVSRLGPYEIIAPLGAGGMGEVYRARDPRLGRDVAVKLTVCAAGRWQLILGRRPTTDDVVLIKDFRCRCADLL